MYFSEDLEVESACEKKKNSSTPTYLRDVSGISRASMRVVKAIRRPLGLVMYTDRIVG